MGNRVQRREMSDIWFWYVKTDSFLRYPEYKRENKQAKDALKYIGSIFYDIAASDEELQDSNYWKAIRKKISLDRELLIEPKQNYLKTEEFGEELTKEIHDSFAIDKVNGEQKFEIDEWVAKLNFEADTKEIIKVNILNALSIISLTILEPKASSVIKGRNEAIKKYNTYNNEQLYSAFLDRETFVELQDVKDLALRAILIKKIGKDAYKKLVQMSEKTLGTFKDRSEKDAYIKKVGKLIDELEKTNKIV